MSKEPLNIVVLGGSFAGLSAVHHYFGGVLPRLETTLAMPRYRLVLVSPSTHLYWNIGAPRTLVSPTWIPISDSFVPVGNGFKHYPAHRFTFIQGSAVAVDTHARTVTLALVPSNAEARTPTGTTRPVENRWSSTSWGSMLQSPVAETQTLPYHALIFATGSSADSPLLSLHGPHEKTVDALKSFHARLVTAESILIAGGGPSGVETAGQLATYYNKNAKLKKNHKDGVDEGYKQRVAKVLHSSSEPEKARESAEAEGARKKGFLSRMLCGSSDSSTAPPRNPKAITLYSGSDRLLPKLPPKIGAKAEEMLKELGVHVVHNTRLVSAQETPGGRTRCVFNNDYSVAADLYIAATGVHPNTAYLPGNLLDDNDYVQTNPDTLRVHEAGERVYAVGDCASYSKNYVLDVYDAIPALTHNLGNDLLAYEYRLQGREADIEGLEDKTYVQNPTDSQLIPITRRGGVGVLMGIELPSIMVHLMKGTDYRVKKAKIVAEKGHNPYAPKSYVYD